MWGPEARAVAVLFGVAATLALCSSSIRSAISIGPDESFEVTKAALWSQGYKLYNPVWDDQPPLHTVLLGTAFKLFGTQVFVARVVSILFGIGLFSGCWIWTKKMVSSLAAFIVIIFLISAPGVFELSISAMLEVPSVGVAMLAAWPLLRWRRSRRRGWLLLSGILLGAALEIKFTAAILLPALIMDIILTSHEMILGNWSSFSAKAVTVWLTAIAITFSILSLTLGSDYGQFWSSHFSRNIAQSAEARGHVLSPTHFLDHVEGLLGTTVGLFIILLKRDWRRMAFPVIMLLTAGIVHAIHRPWWGYYYLHFAVPMAILSAYAIVELLRMARIRASTASPHPTLANVSSLLLASALITSLIVCGGLRFLLEIQRIRHLPKVNESKLIATMKTYASRTQWVYTRFTIFPFHAGLRVPPELAVLPAKRFWSGQITDHAILTAIRRRRPEQILLTREFPDADMERFVSEEYSLAYEDATYRLYLNKSLHQ